MDATEFWAIRAGAAEVENPISPEQFALLGEYCGIRDGMRVLDVGCGKAWLLGKWAKQYQIEAVEWTSTPISSQPPASLPRRPALQTAFGSSKVPPLISRSNFSCLFPRDDEDTCAAPRPRGAAAGMNAIVVVYEPQPVRVVLDDGKIVLKAHEP
ncbi:hypothetical protein [Mesorhizobium sp. M0323]|uniref:hypothetical protein n=1 Tax=Mesorhizobium sp. M0323 TaxID=2956938 RepID=UPI00333D69B5